MNNPSFKILRKTTTTVGGSKLAASASSLNTTFQQEHNGKSFGGGAVIAKQPIVDFRCEYDLPKFCDLNEAAQQDSQMSMCFGDDRFSTIATR